MRKISLDEYAKLEAQAHEMPENLEFNDEIVSIEECGIVEMVDIETSRHHLFYGDDILVHNSVFGKDAKDVDNSTISDSMGTAMTADLLVMLIQNEGQKLKNEIMFKITKNRYSGKTDTFKVITNYSKMRFEDCPDEPSQSFVSEPKLQSVDQSAKPLDINSLLNF